MAAVSGNARELKHSVLFNTPELPMDASKTKALTKQSLLDQLHRYQTKVSIPWIFRCRFCRS